MITAMSVDVRVGARLLLTDVSFTISPGDRVGLVGRNGAGKTTLTRMLAGEASPTAGTITRTGSVGYLPQDPGAAEPGITAIERILSARRLDRALHDLRTAEAAMAVPGSTAAALEKAMNAYARAEARFQARGGYSAEAEAARVASGVGLGGRALTQRLGTLSGGQRRRVELARILFADHDTLLLDEPTNQLDADSVAWLRTFLTGYRGGLVVISHDTGLVADTVNRVFHLDANRAAIDIHNTGWCAYLTRRDADERRRTRERANAERKAAALHTQADKMRARVATAVMAKSMARRADRMLADLEPLRRTERTARIRLPEPAPCGRVPLAAVGLSKAFGSLEVLTGVDLALDRGSRLVVLGLNGAGKTTLLRILSGQESPDSGRVVHGHGLRLGYFAQEHETLDPDRTVRENLAAAAPGLTDGEARGLLGSFLFTGDETDKPVGVLSGGEKTRLALATLVSSGANVLLLDEPTNNLDPVSRGEVLAAVATYRARSSWSATTRRPSRPCVRNASCSSRTPPRTTGTPATPTSSPSPDARKGRGPAIRAAPDPPRLPLSGRGAQDVADDGRAFVRVVLQPVGEVFADDFLNVGVRFGIADLGSGAAFENGMGEFHGDDRGQALVDGVGRDVLVVCGQMPLTTRVVVDDVSERGPEALLVGATLMGAGTVREGAELAPGPGAPLQGDLNEDRLVLVLRLEGDGGGVGETRRVGTEAGDIGAKAVRVVVADRPFRTLVGE